MGGGRHCPCPLFQLQSLDKCHYLAGGYNKPSQVSSSNIYNSIPTRSASSPPPILHYVSGRSTERKWRPSIINIHWISSLYTLLYVATTSQLDTGHSGCSLFNCNWIIEVYHWLGTTNNSISFHNHLQLHLDQHIKQYSQIGLFIVMRLRILSTYF